MNPPVTFVTADASKSAASRPQLPPTATAGPIAGFNLSIVPVSLDPGSLAMANTTLLVFGGGLHGGVASPNAASGARTR